MISKKISANQAVVYKVTACAIFLLGSFLRLFYLGQVPAGMHQDEAFSAWTAFSLLHDRIDSAGNFLPVYLAGWGDGQSALYSWLMIPFLALNRGQWSPLVSRLPQALVGILTVAAVYFLVRKMFGVVPALWCEFLLAVCPWHVMMCRWGLEANLAPGFLLFGLYFFVLGLEKNSFLLLSAFAYGLSLYCYAVIWPIVPIMLLLQTSYGIRHKKITLNRYSVCSALLLFLMALPLMLFVIINTFELSAIRLPFLTIPIMPGYRGGEVTLTLSGMWSNLKRMGHLLLFQNTGSPYDILLPYGMFYDIGRLFIVIGFLCLTGNLWKKLRRREFCFEFLLFVQLLGAGVNTLLVTVNLHQVNSLYIPLVLCEGYGIWCLLKWLGSLKLPKRVTKAAGAVLAAIYLVCLAGFQQLYYTDYRDMVNAYFAQGVQECVSYAMEQSTNLGAAQGVCPDIVIERGAQWPRILLYTRTRAPEYLASVSYKENHVEPASFVKDGVTLYNGIDYNNIRKDAIYIFYYPDMPFFEADYTLTQFYDWYVAVPREKNF